MNEGSPEKRIERVPRWMKDSSGRDRGYQLAAVATGKRAIEGEDIDDERDSTHTGGKRDIESTRSAPRFRFRFQRTDAS
jgi:hypothetical protein